MSLSHRLRASQSTLEASIGPLCHRSNSLTSTPLALNFRQLNRHLRPALRLATNRPRTTARRLEQQQTAGAGRNSTMKRQAYLQSDSNGHHTSRNNFRLVPLCQEALHVDCLSTLTVWDSESSIYPGPGSFLDTVRWSPGLSRCTIEIKRVPCPGHRSPPKILCEWGDIVISSLLLRPQAAQDETCVHFVPIPSSSLATSS